jgi:hypothetical protein
MVPHECRRMRQPPAAAGVCLNEVGDGARCISATDPEAHSGGPASHCAAASLAAAGRPLGSIFEAEGAARFSQGPGAGKEAHFHSGPEMPACLTVCDQPIGHSSEHRCSTGAFKRDREYRDDTKRGSCDCHKPRSSKRTLGGAGLGQTAQEPRDGCWMPLPTARGADALTVEFVSEGANACDA